MATALPMPAGAAGAAFDVEVLEVDRAAGVVRVEGRWSGVRGMRFVRPTLVADGRQALATLDDKPWAPVEGASWRASFPWDAGQEDLAGAVLEVAPSIVVPLDGTAEAAPPGPAVLAPERDGFPMVPPAPVRPADPAPPGDSVPDPRDEELRTLRREVEHQRDELRALRRDVVRLEQQRDEALHDLEAANRTRERAAQRAEEAVAATRAASQERDEARRERDAVAAERDTVRAQRDEVLLAHRALEHQHQRTLAGTAARARNGNGDGPPRARDGAARPEPPEPAASPADADPDAPIGVRAIPAAHTEAADLLETETAPRREISAADLWAVRILGGGAAICFLLLLILLVGLFL